MMLTRQGHMTEQHRKIKAMNTRAQLVPVLVLSALAVLATFDAWRDMFHIAVRDEEASHAFLVPLVVGWLVWVRRRRLYHCRWRGTGYGSGLTLAGVISYCAGDRFLIQSLWHGGAVLILLGCVITVLGGDILKQFFPAAAALVFLVPVPGRIRQRIAIPMERATARATQDVCEALGMPVTRSGNMLTLNGVDVAIAEACNGLRMVIALAMVSYAFAFGTPLRWYVRLAVIVLSPVSAIICNVIRLIPTVWVYAYRPGEFAERFHNVSGWVMLFVSFLALMSVVRILRWALVPLNQYVLAYD